MPSRGGGKKRKRSQGGGVCFECGRPGHIARCCPRAAGKGGGNSRFHHAHGRNKSYQPRYDHTPHDRERSFFDAISKTEDSTISDTEEALRFLKAALAFAEVEGNVPFMYRLVDNQFHALAAIQKSLEYITDQAVFVDGFLPFLECLGREELHKPVYRVPRDSILLAMYSWPFLLPSILDHCRLGRITRNCGKTSLLWFLTVVALKRDSARNDQNVKDLANSIGLCGGSESLKNVLNSITQESVEVSLAETRDSQAEFPGGRHDNDHHDFRSISIIPTLDEFMCEAEPYLPKTDRCVPATEAGVLDRNFRLLREDIIGPSKEQQDDPRKALRDIFYGVRCIGIDTGSAVWINKDGRDILVSGPTAHAFATDFVCRSRFE